MSLSNTGATDNAELSPQGRESVVGDRTTYPENTLEKSVNKSN